MESARGEVEITGVVAFVASVAVNFVYDFIFGNLVKKTSKVAPNLTGELSYPVLREHILFRQRSTIWIWKRNGPPRRKKYCTFDASAT